jgi:peptidoglycan/LPS O-acetylase OafA/YrhL
MTTSPSTETHRLSFIDSFRGLAILFVILFHCYVRWSDRVPFGKAYEGNLLLANGWLGVELFFIISGFVVFMTLTKTSSLSQFAIKRWLRLFPAMLIISLFVLFSASLFEFRPQGIPNVIDLIPGLLFIEPWWLSKLLGLKLESLEAVFWSLYVEVSFYAVFGISYYVIGRRGAIATLILLFSLSLITKFGINESGSGYSFLTTITRLTGADHYGWFLGGIYGYLFWLSRKLYFLGLCVGFNFIATLALKGTNFEISALASGISIMFALALYFPRLQSWLSRRFFLFLGFVSYPLYLVHENMTVSLMIQLGKFWPQEGWFLLPLVSILLPILIAWLTAKWLEPWLRRLLSSIMLRRNRKPALI